MATAEQPVDETSADALAATAVRSEWGHALKNALIPVVTIVGLQFGSLLIGAVVIKVVFSRQGIGFTLVKAILTRDYGVVQALVMLAA